mgnify:CR=1 FL=1
MQVDYTSNVTLNKLINDYLTITYKIKDKEYTSNIVNKTPDEVNDYIYIEVSSNIKEADNIYLNFNIRNYKYIYKDKKEFMNFFDNRHITEYRKIIFVANEAMKEATGTYGRFADAAKYIDPRKE